MSKSSPNNPPAQAMDPAAGAKKHAHDDDVLHVPQGVSRGTFIFLVGLLVFLLVIWMGGDSLFRIAGKGQGNPIGARIKLQSGSTLEWKASELQFQGRALVDALQVDGALANELHYEMGIDPYKPEPKDLTRVLVLDRIAEEAGIEITDGDLRDHLSNLIQSARSTPEAFLGMVAARGLDQRTVESNIRLLLRVSRFVQLVGFAGALPDPKKIEEQWHQENVEFAFDYVALETASLREEARKALPDDAALEAWFGKLGEGEKETFKSAETRTAEVALFRDTETTPATELLAAFPEKPPEGTAAATPEELATRYYNRVYPTRFKKVPPEGAEASTPPEYFKQDEVQEKCLGEGPVFFALQRWIEDLNARRTNGETIDIAAEAQKYGLDHQAFLEPLSSEAFAKDAALGNEEFAAAVFDTPADGSFYASPVALSQGLAVVRTNSRTEPVLPPFAEIRDKVAEKWVEPKAEELAKKRLAALRESLERFTPAPKEKDPSQFQPPEKKNYFRATAEAFQTAVQGAGLELKHRDYLNRAAPPTKDPLSSDEEHRTLTTQAYAFGLYDLESDEVSEAGLSYDKKKVYLVRLAGKRDVPIDEMTPTQYDRYKESARFQAILEAGKRFDLDFLRKNYELYLYEDSPEYKAKQAEKSPGKS
jgi:hypothetical protein